MRFAFVFNLVFLLLILGARFSGNDKYPFLILSLLMVACIGVVIQLLQKQHRAALLLSLPVFYSIAAVLLSRLGVLDSMITLGFR